MNTIRRQALEYLAIGIGLITLSFLASGWSKPSLVTFGTAFLLLAVLFFLNSLGFRRPLLVKVTERIGKTKVTHLSVLLILLPLVITLMQKQYFIPGMAVLYIAYIYYAVAIGDNIAEVLLSIRNKKKRRSIKVS